MTTSYRISFENPTSSSSSSIVMRVNSLSDITYTFWEKGYLCSNNQSCIKDEALDLLYLSIAVFAADRLTLRDNSQDSWTRHIRLSIPVLTFERFSTLKSNIEEMLNFLTGDYWEFDFSPRELSEVEIRNKKNLLKKIKKLPCRALDTVCMFSGGMDSFIGSIDLLKSVQNKESIVFISQYGGGKGTKEYQDKLKEKYIEYFSLDPLSFMQYFVKVENSVENSTRSRSFMFFAHAIAVASTFNRPTRMIVPENGLISLNIPLNYSRIGSSSTRTTHPFYMRKLQDMLTELGLPITISNPYQFKTKGEMMLECKDKDFLIANIGNTMSCAHPDVGRYRGEHASMHCGYCLPCVIRQAAFKKAELEDPSLYFDREFKKVDEAKMIFKSYKTGLRRFNPQKAFFSIQHNGEINSNIEDFTDLYIRGMAELKSYIEDIK